MDTMPNLEWNSEKQHVKITIITSLAVVAVSTNMHAWHEAPDA